MLTRPPAFTPFQNSTAADRHIIIKVVSGGTTWLFSDIDMNLADGHVYPLLDRRITIAQSIDPYSRQWRLSDVKMVLNNADYLGTGATLSDEWGSILNGTVTIYLAAGGLVTALSDCLVRFVGVIATPPAYTEDLVTLTAVDKSRLNVVNLPQNLINDTTGLEGAGVGTVDQKVPLTYGDFVKTFDATTDTGLAVAILYDWVNQNPKTVVSDHILNAITTLYAKVDGLPEPVKYLAATLTADDSGLGTAEADDLTARVFLYPVSNFVGDTSEAEDSEGSQRLSNVNGIIIEASSQAAGTKVRFITGVTPSQVLSTGLMAGQFVTVAGTGEATYNATHVVTDVSLAGWFEVLLTFQSDQTGTYTSGVAINTKRALLSGNQDDSDYAEVFERADSGSDLFAQALFSLDNYATGDNLENDLGKITGLDAEVKLSAGAGVSFSGNVEFEMVWGTDGNERSPLATLGTLTGATFNTVNLALGADSIQIDVDGIAVQNGGNVELPVTGHGLSVNDGVYITGTKNYDGHYVIATTPDANTVGIPSSFTAETFTLSAKIEESPNLANRITWHWLNGHQLVQASGKDYPLVFSIQASTTVGGPGGDGTPGNQVVIRVHEFRLKVDFDLVAKPTIFFAECEGRKYGAWISGRSSNYSAGDMIEDPAGIIESILRDELGLIDADIDMPSFINAENTSVKARINLHSGNEIDSNRVIRQLTEQSSFLFFYSAAGKAKLIDLNDKTPTTATRGAHPVVIPFSHIKEGSLKISKASKIFNSLTYKSRFQQEYNAFRDTTILEDAASIAAFGTRPYIAKWPNLAGASADAIAEFLVGTNGIFSNQHNVIQFEALGDLYSDLEMGDWFEMNVNLDPHVLLYGSSWFGHQFLPLAISKLEDSTKIMGIELFTGTRRLTAFDETVGLWLFQETLLDETANNNDLTADVSPVVYLNGRAESVTAIKQETRIDSASAGDFDFGTGDFTIEGWFNLGEQTEVLIQKRNGSSGPGYRLIHFFVSGGTADEIRFEIATDNAELTDVDSASASVTPGGWHYIVAVVDRSGDATVYIDGVASGTPKTVSGWSGNITIASEDFKLRGQSTATLDDVCITTRVLTTDEITTRANT